MENKKKTSSEQIVTPDPVAAQFAEIASDYLSLNHPVVNACCGTGQLTKYLENYGFYIEGFDSDPQLIAIHRSLYPDCPVEVKDYRKPDEKSYTQVIAFPPPDKDSLKEFFEWLHLNLICDGTAAVLLPFNYYDLVQAPKVRELLHRFTIIHREKLYDPDNVHTDQMEVVIFRLFR